MIVIPQIKPEVIKGLEVDFGSTVSAAIWRKTINNHTWIERAMPVGSIMFFHEAIREADGDQKSPPNPNIWKLCDGLVVNDPESPLNGVAVPNMMDRFPKGSHTGRQTGGQYTINLNHNHGGTGYTDDRGGRSADVGTDHSTGILHNHSMSSAWSTSETMIPKYTALQPYIRYK